MISCVLPLAPSCPTALSETQIDLSWQAAANDGGSTITSYKIEVSEDGNAFTDLHTTDASTLSYSQAGLAAGSTPPYRVASVNSVGTSPYFDVVSATTSREKPACSVAESRGDALRLYPNPTIF